MDKKTEMLIGVVIVAALIYFVVLRPHVPIPLPGTPYAPPAPSPSPAPGAPSPYYPPNPFAGPQAGSTPAYENPANWGAAVGSAAQGVAAIWNASNGSSGDDGGDDGGGW